MAILLGRQSQKIICLHLVGVQRDRALELGLGFAGNDAARRSHQGFAEIGPPGRVFAAIGD